MIEIVRVLAKICQLDILSIFELAQTTVLLLQTELENGGQTLATVPSDHRALTLRIL